MHFLYGNLYRFEKLIYHGMIIEALPQDFDRGLLKRKDSQSQWLCSDFNLSLKVRILKLISGNTVLPGNTFPGVFPGDQNN